MNFREYVLKITLIKNIFQPEMHQIAFGGRAYPGPAGDLTALPQTPYLINGSLLLRKGMGRKWREGRKRVQDGREEGYGKKRKRREGR